MTETLETGINYINGYETVDGKCINVYGNATEFIANNYALESAVWVWAQDHSRCKVFDDNGIEMANLSINDYINTLNISNKDNLFLVSQYYVNGRRGWDKLQLQNISKLDENVSIYTSTEINSRGEYITVYKVNFDGQERKTPNGWENRASDWHNATRLMGGGTIDE